jgi:hypothetical protein
MTLKSLFHHITSFVTWDRASNSASVLNMVTVFCLIEHQSIKSLNNLSRYPFMLYLVAGSSAKAASPAPAAAY